MLKKVSTWNQAWNKVVDLCLIWWCVNEAFNNIMKSSKFLQLENVPLFFATWATRELALFIINIFFISQVYYFSPH